MKKELVCIVCPNGCNLTVDIEDGKVIKVEGNECKRGEKYAAEELTAPKRVLTALVEVDGGITNVTSVKTSCGIPKEKIFEALVEINAVKAKAPLKIGDILIKNVAGSDANVVVTRNA